MKRPKGLHWTEHMIDRLTRLQRAGKLSFAGIAETLSREFGIKLTKNACIGKARRLNLPLRKPVVARKPKAEPQVPEIEPENVPHVRPAWTVEPPVLPAASSRITIYQLQRGVCHYPFGNQPPYAYCGNTTATRSSPWCPHHERVVYPRGAVR